MKALILVAHADDETLGCGGLIQILIKKDWHVSLVVLSDGIFLRDEIQNNCDALKAACHILGVSDFRQIGLKDQRFDQVPLADLTDSVARLGLKPT